MSSRRWDNRTGPLCFAGAAVLGGALAAGTEVLLRRHPPGGAARWTRINHAGRPVSLLEGPAAIIGAALGAVGGAPLIGADPAPALIATIGSGCAGVLDDLAGDGSSKGLRGHLGALRQGRVTTGVIKIVALGASGLLAADGLRGDRVHGRRRVADAVIGGGVIAGSANLANLLDLRPGRTLKATVIAGGWLGIRPGRSLPATLALGVAAALLPDDLAGRTMLGDGGANPLGALVGTALVAQTGPRGRAAALATITALTLAAEKVSFTAVIAATPGLREIDAWGRA